MSVTFPRVHSVTLLALIAACDVEADFPRDPLLQLEGHVVVADPDEELSALAPALVFVTQAGLQIVDVESQGFPNDFRIQVYAPPPAAARIDARDQRNLPPGVELAIAYVAAVPRDHLTNFAYARSAFVGLPPSALAACATAMPACQRVERWCVDDTERECRVLGFPCEEGESCKPTASEGNPAIIDQPSDALAGLSERVVVMWTRAGLPASSIFSHTLGLEQDLQPGYNLVELGELKPDDDSASSDDAILAAALARYNAVHGTAYADLDAAYAELDAPGAEVEALIAFEGEVWFYVDQISVEQGIDVAELVGTKLIEDWTTPLVISVGPDVDPLI